MWKRYGDILNSIKSQMVIDYITKVNKAISNSMVVVEKEDIFDLLIEIANVFQNEIPEIHLVFCLEMERRHEMLIP